MQNGKWMTAAVCIAVIFAGICLEAAAEGGSPSRTLIERLTVAYASGGERDEQALAALSAADPALGEKMGPHHGSLGGTRDGQPGAAGRSAR